MATASAGRFYPSMYRRCHTWTGHKHRLDYTRLPKLTIYIQLTEGTQWAGLLQLQALDTITPSYDKFQRQEILLWILAKFLPKQNRLETADIKMIDVIISHNGQLITHGCEGG